jgi:hypothetical protein
MPFDSIAGQFPNNMRSKKMTTRSLAFHLAAASSALVGLTFPAHAADQSPLTATTASQKPAWLTDLSLGVKETDDDNVFMSGANSQNLPKAYKVPAGSTAALKDRSSLVTTVSPRLGINFAPLLGDQKTLEVLSLGYSSDLFTYHDIPWQKYDCHRFLGAVKGQADNLSFTLDNMFVYVDGSDYGPTYPGGGNFYNAWATVTDGLRVKQLQDTGKLAVRYDWDKFFVRPTVFLNYFDPMSKLLNLPASEGYQNYPGRYDLNGGADVGYKISPATALTLGYRYGHQYQQQMSFSPDSSPNDYQRVLFGAEGKPTDWLTMSLQGGPDFRSYAPNTATHITPVTNLHPLTYYGEASVTAQASPADSFSFKYKAYQWLSICGKLPFFDNRYELNYHRTLTDTLGLDLGARAWNADFTSGNLSTSLRNDMLFTPSAGLTWSPTPHLGATLAYTGNLGRNLEHSTAPLYRDFDQNLFSLGVQYKF